MFDDQNWTEQVNIDVKPTTIISKSRNDFALTMVVMCKENNNKPQTLNIIFLSLLKPYLDLDQLW